MRIFECTTADDFDTLRDLGVLVEVDPRQGTHTPTAFPPGGQDEMLAALDRIRAEPKRRFHPAEPARPAGERAVRGVRSLLRRS